MNARTLVSFFGVDWSLFLGYSYYFSYYIYGIRLALSPRQSSLEIQHPRQQLCGRSKELCKWNNHYGFRGAPFCAFFSFGWCFRKLNWFRFWFRFAALARANATTHFRTIMWYLFVLNLRTLCLQNGSIRGTWLTTFNSKLETSQFCYWITTKSIFYAQLDRCNQIC